LRRRIEGLEVRLDNLRHKERCWQDGAGVPQDNLTRHRYVFVELQARLRLLQQPGQRRLAAPTGNQSASRLDTKSYFGTYEIYVEALVFSRINGHWLTDVDRQIPNVPPPKLDGDK
jgi:hypothetical protein